MSTLEALSRMVAGIPRGSAGVLLPNNAELDVYCGHEVRTAADHYRWVGDNRWYKPHEPSILLQYTFGGFGIFEDSARVLKILPGQAFTAILPSEHVYYLPKESTSWTFFWLIFRHTYVVQRIAALHQTRGPLIVAAPESDFVQRMVELYTGARKSSDDRFARERKLFELLVAADRASHAMQHAPSEREHLLLEVHRIIGSHTGPALTVDDLAAEFGHSRSNFSHHFRNVTGLTPAAYLRDLRLERAREMLLDSDAPLKAVALATGFADNNHFTKAFRRRFGFTPGAFRAQLKKR